MVLARSNSRRGFELGRLIQGHFARFCLVVRGPLHQRYRSVTNANRCFMLLGQFLDGFWCTFPTTFTTRFVAIDNLVLAVGNNSRHPDDPLFGVVGFEIESDRAAVFSHVRHTAPTRIVPRLFLPWRSLGPSPWL